MGLGGHLHDTGCLDGGSGVDLPEAQHCKTRCMSGCQRRERPPNVGGGQHQRLIGCVREGPERSFESTDDPRNHCGIDEGAPLAAVGRLPAQNALHLRVQHEGVHVAAGVGEARCQRTGESLTDKFRELLGIFDGAAMIREGLEDCAQVADADALLEERLEDLDDLAERHDRGDQLLDEFGVHEGEFVHELLGLEASEELGGVGADELGEVCGGHGGRIHHGEAEDVCALGVGRGDPRGGHPEGGIGGLFALQRASGTAGIDGEHAVDPEAALTHRGSGDDQPVGVGGKLEIVADPHGRHDDAVAGIIITAINIIAGIIIGVAQNDLTFAEATEAYTILTVGDGLVSQIPALLVSAAAGLIATRTASGADLGSTIRLQILGRREPLLLASVVLAGIALLPGMPSYTFFALSGGCFFLSTRAQALEAEAAAAREREAAAEAGKPVDGNKPAEPSLAELMAVDLLALEVGFDLVPLVDKTRGGELLNRN